MDPVSLQKIADLLGARLVLKAEQPKTLIRAIKPLHQAGDEDLSFLANPKYAQYLPQTRALAVLVHEEFLGQVPQHTHALVMKDPYLGFAKAAQLFAKPLNLPAGIHPTAVVGAHCQIDPSASIGPHVVLGEGVSIAARAMIGANTSLADGVVIGENTKIYPNVSIYRDVKIGKNGVIHSGVVLGSDGFGMARDESGWVKIPQLGSVIIGDDVEIGSNTTIDCGALGHTEIHCGVKIDNQVHIGHNVIVGENSVLVARVGVSGSTKIGKNCILAGKVGTAGHLEIADNVVVSGAGNVTKSLTKPGVYASVIPVRPQKEWSRTVALLRKLDTLFARVGLLEKQVNKED